MGGSAHFLPTRPGRIVPLCMALLCHFPANDQAAGRLTAPWVTRNVGRGLSIPILCDQQKEPASSGLQELARELSEVVPIGVNHQLEAIDHPQLGEN